MMSSQSELEVPYALDFSSDDGVATDDENDVDANATQDTDDGGRFESPGKEGREPLRAGDVITYTNPVFTTGTTQGRRKAVVVGVNPHHETFPLVLDNTEQLPWDTPVQRIGEFHKGRVTAHPGRMKPIDSFLLKVSGDTNLAHVLMKKAKQLKHSLNTIKSQSIRAYVRAPHHSGSANRRKSISKLNPRRRSETKDLLEISKPTTRTIVLSSSDESSVLSCTTSLPKSRSKNPRKRIHPFHDDDDDDNDDSSCSTTESDDSHFLFTQDLPFYSEFHPKLKRPSIKLPHSTQTSSMKSVGLAISFTKQNNKPTPSTDNKVTDLAQATPSKSAKDTTPGGENSPNIFKTSNINRFTLAEDSSSSTSGEVRRETVKARRAEKGRDHGVKSLQKQNSTIRDHCKVRNRASAAAASSTTDSATSTRRQRNAILTTGNAQVSTAERIAFRTSMTTTTRRLFQDLCSSDESSDSYGDSGSLLPRPLFSKNQHLEKSAKNTFSVASETPNGTLDTILKESSKSDKDCQEMATTIRKRKHLQLHSSSSSSSSSTGVPWGATEAIHDQGNETPLDSRDREAVACMLQLKRYTASMSTACTEQRTVARHCPNWQENQKHETAKHSKTRNIHETTPSNSWAFRQRAPKNAASLRVPMNSGTSAESSTARESRWQFTSLKSSGHRYPKKRAIEIDSDNEESGSPMQYRHGRQLTCKRNYKHHRASKLDHQAGSPSTGKPRSPKTSKRPVRVHAPVLDLRYGPLPGSSTANRMGEDSLHHCGNKAPSVRRLPDANLTSVLERVGVPPSSRKKNRTVTTGLQQVLGAPDDRGEQGAKSEDCRHQRPMDGATFSTTAAQLRWRSKGKGEGDSAEAVSTGPSKSTNSSVSEAPSPPPSTRRHGRYFSATKGSPRRSNSSVFDFVDECTPPSKSKSRHVTIGSKKK